MKPALDSPEWQQRLNERIRHDAALSLTKEDVELAKQAREKMKKAAKKYREYLQNIHPDQEAQLLERHKRREAVRKEVKQGLAQRRKAYFAGLSPSRRRLTEHYSNMGWPEAHRRVERHAQRIAEDLEIEMTYTKEEEKESGGEQYTLRIRIKNEDQQKLESIKGLATELGYDGATVDTVPQWGGGGQEITIEKAPARDLMKFLREVRGEQLDDGDEDEMNGSDAMENMEQ